MPDQQLDKNYLVIRKRTFGELIDLTFRLTQKEGRQVFFWFFCLAFPFAVLNYYLTSLITAHWEWTSSEEAWQAFSMGINLILTLFEIPFASSLAILYLGKRTFAPEEKPDRFEIVGSWLEVFPQLFLYLILLYPVTLLYECTVEIITLERTPLFSRKKERISTFKRLRIFHRERFGEQIGFFILAVLFCVLVLPGVLICVETGVDLLFGKALDDVTFFPTVIFPVLLWSVYGLLLILHFLRYLDMRIEREGWDVELAFRAERLRVKKQ
ncbi:MAG: hypothetical protein LBQ54_03655 [Planctomycetaceae bacterium]|jgi:hypothetical protein|nr:hypothetical protein [Planctomycetaceae bacterium]